VELVSAYVSEANHQARLE